MRVISTGRALREHLFQQTQKLIENFLGESAFYPSFKGSDASKCKEAV